MNWTIVSHLVYLAITVPLTVWVATELSRNGRVFLADVFADKEEFAVAINKLLVVGFYLLNLGFVMLYLRSGGRADGAEGVFDSASIKVGVVLLTLGVLHFLNVYVFNRLRRRQLIGHVPVQHFQAMMPVPGPMPGQHYPPQPPARG